MRSAEEWCKEYDWFDCGGKTGGVCAKIRDIQADAVDGVLKAIKDFCALGPHLIAFGTLEPKPSPVEHKKCDHSRDCAVEWVNRYVTLVRCAECGATRKRGFTGEWEP